MNNIRIFKNDREPVRRKPGAPLKYPWLTMEVGEAFIAPIRFENFQVHVRRSARVYGRKFHCEPVKGGTKVIREA